MLCKIAVESLGLILSRVTLCSPDVGTSCCDCRKKRPADAHRSYCSKVKTKVNNWMEAWLR